ncbi:MAG: hypothetical protein ABEJ98_05905 [Candidatus Nanohaloarchaea archaeon]
MQRNIGQQLQQEAIRGMKGMTSSRAVLAVIGALMAVAALGAGIAPLMNMLGLADKSSDFNRLRSLEQATREKCKQAKNNAARFRTELNLEFKKMQRLEVAENNGEEFLKASFKSSSPWKSRTYICDLTIKRGGKDFVTEGDWNFNITGSGGENPGVTIEVDPR